MMRLKDKNRFINLFLLFILIIIVIYFRFRLCQITDDAFITYTYARNLAEGNGLVYNPGERVMGFTSILYTLLLAGFYYLGFHKLWFISLILDCLFIPAILLILREMTNKSHLFSYGVILYLLFQPAFSFPIPGMETGLFLFCLISSLFTLSKNKYLLSSFLAGITVLVRPEGVLLFPIVMTKSLWDFEKGRLRDNWWKFLLAYIIPVGIVFVSLTLYYGSPIPQSIVAKRRQTEVTAIWPTFIDVLHIKMFFILYKFNFLSILEILGCILLLRQPSPLRPLIIYGVLYVMFVHHTKQISLFPSQFLFHHPPLLLSVIIRLRTMLFLN